MAELVAERLLGVRRDDDQRLLCFTARTFTLRLHHIKTSLWLDTFDAFCLNYSFWSDHLSTFCLNRILGFGRETTSFCNRVLWLAAYPEGALGDADSSPGDGHGVFERGVGRVGAGVQPVTFTPHLHVHWDSISILTDRQTDKKFVNTSWRKIHKSKCGSMQTFVWRMKEGGNDFTASMDSDQLRARENCFKTLEITWNCPLNYTLHRLINNKSLTCIRQQDTMKRDN